DADWPPGLVHGDQGADVVLGQQGEGLADRLLGTDGDHPDALLGRDGPNVHGTSSPARCERLCPDDSAARDGREAAGGAYSVKRWVSVQEYGRNAWQGGAPARRAAFTGPSSR